MQIKIRNNVILESYLLQRLMSEPKWIETRKECEISERGELIPKRVTFELEKEKENPWKYKPKEIIDLSLRLIGLFAIAVPIYLFYKNQEADRNKQNALFQLDIYSKTAIGLHSLEDKDVGSKEFNESKARLFYEIYPKIVLLNNKHLIDTFKVVKDILDFYSLVSDKITSVDSVHNLLKEHVIKGDYYIDIKDSIKIAPNNFKPIANKLGQLCYTFYNNYDEFTEHESKTSDSLLKEEAQLVSEALTNIFKECYKNRGYFDTTEIEDHDPELWRYFEESLTNIYTNARIYIIDSHRLLNYDFKEHLKEYAGRLDSMMVESRTMSLQLP